MRRAAIRRPRGSHVAHTIVSKDTTGNGSVWGLGFSGDPAQRSLYVADGQDEKVWVLDFARFMPPTMITRSIGAARHFLKEQGQLVLKPLHGNAGKAVFKVSRDGANGPEHDRRTHGKS